MRTRQTRSKKRSATTVPLLFLMPAEDILAQINSKDVSITTLEDLSERYAVSIEAAFLRLRGLRLWNCEMTIWHRMLSGAFVVDRIHGWLKADWRWADDSIPNQAWSQKGGATFSGRTLVCLDRSDGLSAAEPVYFQVKRRGENLVAIWGNKQFRASKSRRGLFEKNPK